MTRGLFNAQLPHQIAMDASSHLLSSFHEPRNLCSTMASLSVIIRDRGSVQRGRIKEYTHAISFETQSFRLQEKSP